MEKALFWQSRVVRHGIVWLLVVSLFALLAREAGAGNLRTLGMQYTAVLLGVQAVAIYGHFWLLTRLLERRRYWQYPWLPWR